MSKYYPVANYSYPRNDSIAPYGARSLNDRDRSSLGSQSSAPGLIDDHTDSEVSVDDDYQYHTHAAELWDSFWQAGLGDDCKEQPRTQPRKQYPALIPSPQNKRKRSIDGDGAQGPSWPLPNNPIHKTRRRPAATYSAVPQPVSSRSSYRAGSSWQSSRASTPKPQRPPRPDEKLLTPCIQRTAAPIRTTFTTLPERPTTPCSRRPLTLLTHRPKTSLEDRPATSLGNRPVTPVRDRGSVSSDISAISPHSRHSQHQAKRKVMAKASCPSLRPDPEPQSVFEYDDDSNDESNGRYFFRFHRRSDCDNRRSRDESDAAHASSTAKRRDRSSTLPPSSRRQRQESESAVKDVAVTPRWRRSGGGEVLGRMLGRRSR